ncbi:MAG TPA: pyridoxal-phosphate dependent enzyme [Chloroflexota bacterium]|nr:pyridoxal-phosphate dependent enzyme [Chloroflexota bacterium]
MIAPPRRVPQPALRAAAYGQSILERVGNTPLIAPQRVVPANPSVQLLIKAEWFNPGGSVKDRAALQIVLDAERRGDLAGGKTLIDSSSGNTGIAYAMVGAALGFPVELVMPASVSEERKLIAAGYGAKITYSDPYEGSDGAIRLVRRVIAEQGERYYYADQYSNPSNWQAHYQGSGPEIWRQTQGKITHFVAGLGTSGTIMGTGRYLRECNPQVQIVGVQPDDALHGIEGLKHMESAIVPAIYDEHLLDQKLLVNTEEAFDLTRRMAREEGIFAGGSSGAAMLGALRLAETLDTGVIVVVFPDGGDKYLTTSLWKYDSDWSI